jgi:uncharacterized membrane protein
MYIIYNDSLFNEENVKKTVQAKMTYDFEKKLAKDSTKNAIDQQISNDKILAQKAKIKKDEIRRYGLYGGLCLLLIFSVFIFNRFRVAKKQKLLIEMQKEMVEEKQKEVLDSIHYAKRIQRSLLPTEIYIERNLRRLQKK